MDILPVYLGLLQEQTDISEKVGDRVYLEVADQNESYPNIILSMPDTGQDYTHSGPTGLFDGQLIVVCRSKARSEVNKLGWLVTEFLETWKGRREGVIVELTEFTNHATGYDEKSETFKFTIEFTSFFKKEIP